jgi:uncharacterized membrane protein YeaQ/YmgE (transglycosylase-associated protein family)
MGMLSWVGFGFLAGAIARFIMPKAKDGSSIGIIMTVILGILGSSVGGYVGSHLGWGSITGFDARSIGLSVVGAILVLAGYRKIFS